MYILFPIHEALKRCLKVDGVFMSLHVVDPDVDSSQKSRGSNSNSCTGIIRDLLVCLNRGPLVFSIVLTKNP